MGTKGSITVRGPRVCQTCIWSKEHPDFHKDLMNCNYFDANSLDTIMDVMWKHRCPLKVINVQRHVKNHLAPKMEKMRTAQVARALSSGAYIRKDSVALNAEPIDTDDYEAVIDDTIRRYHMGVREGTIKITAKEGLAALKMKSDIVAKNKDRTVDAVKTIFQGSAPTVRQS